MGIHSYIFQKKSQILKTKKKDVEPHDHLCPEGTSHLQKQN